MKKNRLITLLALTSCVAALSSCGKEDPVIKVKGLSNEVVVGSTIDLDSYVKVSGSSKSYKIYLYKDSESLVELSGHKLKVLAEGEITFLVYIGKVEVKVELNSYNQMRYDLMQNFKGYSHKYTMYGEKDTYLHRDGYAERSFYHLSDERYYREGIMSPNEGDASYRYVVDDHNNFEFDAKLVAKDEFVDYNGAFGVDFTKTKKGNLKVGGKNQEAYSLTASQLKVFAKNNLIAEDYTKFYASLPVDETGKYSASSTTYGEIPVSLGAVYFTMMKNGSKEVPTAVLFASISGSAVYLDALTFGNKSTDLVEDDVVVEKLDSEIEVGLPIVASFQNFFKNELAESKNFIIEYDTDWVNSSGAHTTFPSQYSSYWFAKLPVYNAKRVLSGDSIVTISGGEVTGGVVNHGVDTVWEFFKTNNGYSKRVNEDYLDVYNDEYNSTSLIGRETNWPSELLYLDSVKKNSEEDPTDVTATYKFNLDRYYDLMDAVFFTDDTVAKVITTFIKAGYTDYAEWFGEMGSLKYSPSSELVELTFGFALTNTLNYRVSFKIKPDTEHAYDAQIADFISGLFA